MMANFSVSGKLADNSTAQVVRVDFRSSNATKNRKIFLIERQAQTNPKPRPRMGMQSPFRISIFGEFDPGSG
jgi:hypothetical protein